MIYIIARSAEAYEICKELDLNPRGRNVTLLTHTGAMERTRGRRWAVGDKVIVGTQIENGELVVEAFDALEMLAGEFPRTIMRGTRRYNLHVKAGSRTSIEVDVMAHTICPSSEGDTCEFRKAWGESTGGDPWFEFDFGDRGVHTVRVMNSQPQDDDTFLLTLEVQS